MNFCKKNLKHIHQNKDLILVCSWIKILRKNYKRPDKVLGTFSDAVVNYSETLYRGYNWNESSSLKVSTIYDIIWVP